MLEVRNDLEEPPGQRQPPAPWHHVPWENWNDWRWQLRHRLNTAEDLARVIRLTPEERATLDAARDLMNRTGR